MAIRYQDSSYNTCVQHSHVAKRIIP